MKRGCGLFLAVLAVALTGCGGSDPATEAETIAAANPSHAIPPVLEDIALRLKTAGIPAKATALYEGEAQVGVRGAEIDYWADPSKAAKEGAEFLQLATGHSQKVMADVYGQVIVWTAKEQPLTSAERARFEEISKIVDPQR